MSAGSRGFMEIKQQAIEYGKMWLLVNKQCLFLVLLLFCFVLDEQRCSALADDPDCFSPLFVFGASMVDVGENAAVLPFRSYTEFPPYGLDYFPRPAGRFSNGRLFIDFITQGLGYGLIDPYFKSVGADFTHGVNFASSGATASNTTIVLSGNSSNGLFSLSVQIDQFHQFKEAVRAEFSSRKGNLQGLPTPHGISNGVYFIEAGHNDYLSTAFRTSDYDANSSVATTISSIEVAIKNLYNEGARNIVVTNIIPLGCTPIVLGNFEPEVENQDMYGCMAMYNDLVDSHNERLEAMLGDLRANLVGAMLILFDINRLLWKAIKDPESYGLNYTIKACCGAGGGKYNYESSVHCGTSGFVDGVYMSAIRCHEPSLYIFWDSVHAVESFGRHIADGFLTGEYLKPTFSVRSIFQHCESVSS